MIIRRIDAEGDWIFGKGLSGYVFNQEAIEENLRTRILSWLGDCFFALNEGIDWNNRLDVGQKKEIVDELKSMILKSFGVTGVNSIDFTFNGTTRLFLVEYDIVTIYSPSFSASIQQLLGVNNA